MKLLKEAINEFDTNSISHNEVKESKLLNEIVDEFNVNSISDNKIKKSKLLKEAINEFDVISEQEGGTTATGAVSGFTGRAGQDVDDRFAGPFHPDFNDLRKTLKLQLDKTLAKQIYNKEITPILYDDYLDVEWKYEFDEYGIDINPEDFINDSESNWKEIKTNLSYDKNPIIKNYLKNKSKDEWEFIDTDLKYDNNKPYIEEDNFINNSSTNWKSIDTDLKYDKNEKYIEEKNFINKSSTNWEFIKEI